MKALPINQVQQKENMPKEIDGSVLKADLLNGSLSNGSVNAIAEHYGISSEVAEKLRSSLIHDEREALKLRFIVVAGQRLLNIIAHGKERSSIMAAKTLSEYVLGEKHRLPLVEINQASGVRFEEMLRETKLLEKTTSAQTNDLDEEEG